MLEDLENITRFQATSQRRSIIQRKPSMQPLPEKDDTDSINSVSLEATAGATGEQNEEKVNLNSIGQPIRNKKIVSRLLKKLRNTVPAPPLSAIYIVFNA